MKSLGKFVIFGLLVGFFLSVFTGSNYYPQIVSASDIGSPRIKMNSIHSIDKNSSIEEIVNLLKSSPIQWKTIELTYESEFRYPDNTESFWSSISQFKLESMGRGQLTVIDNGISTLNWVNNGDVLWTEYPRTKTYRQSNLPSTLVKNINSASTESPSMSNINSAFDTGALFIPSAFNEYIYPVSIGQELLKTQITETVRQEIRIGGLTDVCNRPALQIDRIAMDTTTENSIGRWHRYWIDTETGILLQVEILDPSTGDWVQKTVATEFILNPVFDSDIFNYVVKPDWKMDNN